MSKRKEPVETMSRMDLMREVHHWRERGPALEAVARAAEAINEGTGQPCKRGCGHTLCRALSRLRSLSGLRAPSTVEVTDTFPANSRPARSQSKKGAPAARPSRKEGDGHA